MSFRPELEYWKTVLTNEKPWDDEDATGAKIYKKDQHESLKATGRIAVRSYIMGNGQLTDTNTDFETAYKIPEALRQ